MNTRKLGQGSLMIIALFFAFLMAGCGSDSETTNEKTEAEAVEAVETEEVETIAALTEAEEAMVQQVAAITTAVEKAPATADAILKQFGMTTEEYEAAVYKIAESPSLSEAYDKAMGN